MAQDMLSRKTRLFKSLDHLSNDDTHSAEREDQSMLLLDMPSSPSAGSTNADRWPNTTHGTRRSWSPGPRSSPALFSSSPQRSPSRDRYGGAGEGASKEAFKHTEIVKDSPLRIPTANKENKAQKKSLITTDVLKSNPVQESALPRAGGKRKRGKDPAKEIPEELKMFRGLRFFFFPNSDIAPDRRRRIAKVIEYGGTRVKEWGPGITHLVFDNRLEYSELFRCTDITEVPSNVITVNSMYAPDCVAFKRLLNPDQPQYYPQGAPQTKKPLTRDPCPSPSPRSSLSVNMSKKERMMIAQQTPPREEEESPPRPMRNIRPAQVNELERPYQIKVHHGDQLNEAIAEVKATEHLPLDSDDEDSSRPSSAHTDPEDVRTEDSSPQRKPVKKLKRPNADWKSAFQCMQPPQSASALGLVEKNKKGPMNPSNLEIICILQQMADYYASTRDEWRTFAYRKAITVLRKHPHEIFTAKQASELPCIGSRLAAKIEEIKITHRLRRLENTHLEPTDQALKVFLKMYGVGYTQAMRWIQYGHRTLANLRTGDVALTDNQRIGLEHYEDFLTRIPRDEVARHGAIVEKALLGLDPKFEVTVGGSYQRGASDCGDIDVVITRPGTSINFTRTLVLERLVPTLFATGFLKVGLAVTSRDTGTKWHGACQLPSTSGEGARNPWRRIDLLLVPWSERGAAMIYFTGNDIFNRSLRLLARKKGMRLNQRGLYRDVMRGPGQKKLNEGVKVAGEDEREVFKVLGVPWRECWERDL